MQSKIAFLLRCKGITSYGISNGLSSKSTSSNPQPKRPLNNSRISHKLSSILRHGNDGFKNKIDNLGWLDLDELLNTSNFCQKNNVTKNQIIEVVKNCPKQRFAIDLQNNKIKANQGHTIKLSDQALKILSIEEINNNFPHIVHGTYYKSLELIMKRGLNKMARTHVHFTASDKIDGQNVVSGYRKDCEILIYLDIKKITEAIQNNDLVFQISENNVILCAGDDEGHVDRLRLHLEFHDW